VSDPQGNDERGAVGYVPKVGDRIRIRRPHGGSETGRVRSSWPDLREGYADLDRKGRCPECEQPTPRGERFRYDEVAPLSDSQEAPVADIEDSARTLAEKHVEHYRSCGCLGDGAVCCDPRCECHDEAKDSGSTAAES
jgi:hypothetical protein